MDGQTKGMLAVCEARAELVTSVLPNEKRRSSDFDSESEQPITNGTLRQYVIVMRGRFAT